MVVFKRVSPYADDEMNLPVNNVDDAASFYQTIMGFHIVSKIESPYKKIIFGRDDLKFAITENGGDSSQEGCFFEVDDVEEIFEEFKENGLNQENANFRFDKHGEISYKVFFVVSPDGLCYCLGERQD